MADYLCSVCNEAFIHHNSQRLNSTAILLFLFTIETSTGCEGGGVAQPRTRLLLLLRRRIQCWCSIYQRGGFTK